MCLLCAFVLFLLRLSVGLAAAGGPAVLETTAMSFSIVISDAQSVCSEF